MRYTLFIFLSIQSVSCYSQFFVGDSKATVKSVLQKNKIQFSEMKLSDTTSRLSWIVEDKYQEILVIDTSDIVTVQTILPEKDQVINEFVKWFNKDFVIMSATEWRNYANGKIYKIQLSYILGEALFSISLIQNSSK